MTTLFDTTDVPDDDEASLRDACDLASAEADTAFKHLTELQDRLFHLRLKAGASRGVKIPVDLPRRIEVAQVAYDRLNQRAEPLRRRYRAVRSARMVREIRASCERERRAREVSERAELVKAQRGGCAACVLAYRTALEDHLRRHPIAAASDGRPYPPFRWTCPQCGNGRVPFL